MLSNKDDARSEYRVSSQDLVRNKIFKAKNITFGGSTNVTSISTNTKTKTSHFPSLGKKASSHTANKILERIQQIEKVKQVNKLKLEREL